MTPRPAHPLHMSSGAPPSAHRLAACIFALAAAFLLLPVASRAGKLNLSPEVKEGLRRVYSGDTSGAIEIARGIQHSQRQHPLGYLLEANALWWKIYCAVCGVKWNLIDAWDRANLREDAAYFALADRAIAL